MTLPTIVSRLRASIACRQSTRALLLSLNHKVDLIMATLADIQTAETEEATAITAVVGEIAQLETDLASAQAAGSDPTAIQAIVDQIHANTDKLKAALPPASTPTDPQPAAA